MPQMSSSDATSLQSSLPGMRQTVPDGICRRIISRVAVDYGLSPDELTAPTRGRPRIAFARQVAMYLAHVGFALSFEMIGRAFGRDRTTVAHACRVVEDARDDVWFDCRLAVLERACHAEPTAKRAGQ